MFKNEEWKAWLTFVALMAAPILIIAWAIVCFAVLG